MSYGKPGTFSSESYNVNSALLQSTRVGRANNSAEEMGLAALYIASNAIDAADCAQLLDMLGITKPHLGYRWVTDASGHRRRVKGTPSEAAL